MFKISTTEKNVKILKIKYHYIVLLHLLINIILDFEHPQWYPNDELKQYHFINSISNIEGNGWASDGHNNIIFFLNCLSDGY